MRNDDTLVKIVEHVADLEEYSNGWLRELNIVSWNSGPPKWDIRQWSPDHSRMSRGITMTNEEMDILVKAYTEHGGIKHDN